MPTLNVFGIEPESIVDGPGLRYAIFVQGCTHKCPGCHNPESQPHTPNNSMDVDDIFKDIMSRKLVGGVTFSGGEPFEQPEALASLAKKLKNEGISIWCWSGYLYEDIVKDEAKSQLLKYVDVLVDGPFVLAKKSMGCSWRGSTNQRLIDVAKSSPDNIVEWAENDPLAKFTKPASW